MVQWRRRTFDTGLLVKGSYTTFNKEGDQATVSASTTTGVACVVVGESGKHASGIGLLRRNQQALDRFTAVVELPMLVITALWIPVLVVPLIWPVHGSVAETIAIVDYTVWALFALEYLIKLYLAPNRWKFVGTHLLDLFIVAVPFLRPIRLAHITQLGRVGILVQRGGVRVKSVATHQGLHFVLPAIGVIILASAGVVTVAERSAHGSSIQNLGDGLWWAIVTVATVGYGDISPVTPIGRGVAVLLMLAGIGLIGVLTATVASYFVGEAAGKVEAEREQLRNDLAEARAQRDHLAAKLDQLSEQMDQILLALASRGEPGHVAVEDPPQREIQRGRPR